MGALRDGRTIRVEADKPSVLVFAGKEPREASYATALSYWGQETKRLRLNCQKKSFWIKLIKWIATNHRVQMEVHSGLLRKLNYKTAKLPPAMCKPCLPSVIRQEMETVDRIRFLKKRALGNHILVCLPSIPNKLSGSMIKKRLDG